MYGKTSDGGEKRKGREEKATDVKEMVREEKEKGKDVK